jgi:hypothetical protein
MLRENLINIYEASFRENHTLPALTDYFKQESFTYLEMGAEIAKLPAGVYEYRIAHDPVPGVADEGIPINLKITVDPAEGEITVDRLRQHARTAMMLERIGETQRGDLLVIPSQFGLRHAGRSVRRGRAVYAKTEFGHGALAVGSMTLTHPKRFVRWEQLHTDCAGDGFAPEADGVFSRAPFFDFDGGKVKFGARPVADAHDQCGTSSGFLPQ